MMIDHTRQLGWPAGFCLLASLAAGCGQTVPPPAQLASTSVPDSSRPAAADPDPKSPDTLALPESERRHLWQIEHWVLVLDFKFWPGLAAALRDQDAAAARRYFATDAQCQRLRDEPAAPSESLPFGEARSVSKATTDRQPVSPDELADYLLARVAQFRPDRKVTIKTVALSPENRDRPDGRWQGRFQLRVAGQLSDQAPAELFVEAECELEGLTEPVPQAAAWLKTCRVVEERFCAADRYLAREVGKSWGFDRALFHDNWQSSEFPKLATGGVFLTDYDLDGRADVLIADSKQSVFYHQRKPGVFEDAILTPWLDDLPAGSPIAFADLDNDNYPDLIAADKVYRNTGRGTFTLVGRLPELHHVEQISGFAVADYDRDGLIDVYVTRGTPGPASDDGRTSWLNDRSGFGNTLLRSSGNWSFVDVTSTSGAAAGLLSCFAAAWLDANDDMWPDLFVSDEFGSPVLLVNQKDGTFRTQTVTHDFGGFCMGAAAGDLDDDGRTDLYLANMYSKAGERVLSNLNLGLYPPEIAVKIRHIVNGSELWRNAGNLEFESRGRAAGVARVGWAYGPCLADFDNDGRLDIYAPAGFYSVSRTEPDG